ncbi:MAG TPA: DUF2127 domain-containing protein [Ilumatobacteraceae bacterium]|jgi:uncharacterized membrane protein
MPIFTATSEMDRLFKVSILLKAADGLLEVVGAILMFLISPARIDQIARTLTQHELSRDPHDFFARHLLHSAHDFTAGGRAFAVVYLASHGLSKIVLVVLILREHLWAYTGMIVLLAVFIVYQIYRLTYKPSFSLVFLTLFDALVIYLTVREQKRQRRVLQADNEPFAHPRRA